MADVVILLPAGDLAGYQILARHFDPILRAHYSVAPLAIARPDIVARLAAPVKPKAVILADDAIVSSKKHNWLVTHLVDYLGAGGTLILGFAFACHHNGPRFDKLMRERFGLSWRADTCMRTTHELQAPFRLLLNSVLVTRYSQHARTLVGVAPDARVYVPVPRKKTPASQAQTAVAFEKCQGKGYLAYIGDLAITDGSQAVVMAILHFAMRRARDTSDTQTIPVAEPTRVIDPTPAADPVPVPAAAPVADARKTPAATPAAPAPDPPTQPKPGCDVCGKASQQKCGGCKKTSYCSRDCQRAAWPTHMKICATLRTRAGDAALPAGASGPQNAGRTPTQVASRTENELQTAASRKGKMADTPKGSGPAKASAPTSRPNGAAVKASPAASASEPKKAPSQSKPAPGAKQGSSQAASGSSSAKKPAPPKPTSVEDGLADVFARVGLLPGDVKVTKSAPNATSLALFPAFMNMGAGGGPNMSVLFANMTLSGTIKRVIGTYKLYVEEQHDLSKVSIGLYAVPSGTLPVAHFEVFLDKLERCPGLLPVWWDALARETCVETARTPGAGTYIGTPCDTSELGDPHMMMMMRTVSGALHGAGISGFGP